MKSIFVVLLVTFVCWQSFAQLRMEKEFGGVQYYNGTQELRPKEVLELMKPNTEAYTEFKKARGNSGFANVLAFAGGALIGWPIGTSLGGGDPQWGLAAGGAGLILLAIPLSISGGKHATKAIELYNGKSASSKGTSLRIIPMGTGMKLVFQF